MGSFVFEFSGLDTTALIAHLASCPVPFEPSALYDAVSEEKRIDTELRLSSFRALTDAASFDIAAALVATLSIPHASLTLVRNDVTHIAYAKGGFFKPHQDFLSLVSNVVEEYTLLICALPADAAARTKGGETRITAGGGLEVVSKATTTAGCALLFRKDLVHEGLPVRAGTKEVVALNLWGTRHDCSTLLRVVFPHAGGAGGGGGGGGGAAEAGGAKAPAAPQLRPCARCGAPSKSFCSSCKDAAYCKEECQRADWGRHQRACSLAPLRAEVEARSFVLSEGAIRATPTCIFNGKLRWAAEGCEAGPTGGGGSGGATRVITYRSMVHTYEEFATVFRALQGMYVRPCDVVRHGGALDFFGVPLSSVLVSTVAMGNAGKAAHEMDGFGGGPPAPPPPLPHGLAQELIAAAAPPEAVPLVDAAIMVATTDERARVAAEAAKALGLPYVRFCAIFAEGTVAYGGEMSGTPAVTIPMQPVWATVGDYHNLLGEGRRGGHCDEQWLHAAAQRQP